MPGTATASGAHHVERKAAPAAAEAKLAGAGQPHHGPPLRHRGAGRQGLLAGAAQHAIPLLPQHAIGGQAQEEPGCTREAAGTRLCRPQAALPWHTASREARLRLHAAAEHAHAHTHALTSPAALVWVASSGTSCPSGRYAISPHLKSTPSSRCTALVHTRAWGECIHGSGCRHREVRVRLAGEGSGVQGGCRAARGCTLGACSWRRRRRPAPLAAGRAGELGCSLCHASGGITPEAAPHHAGRQALQIRTRGRTVHGASVCRLERGRAPRGAARQGKAAWLQGAAPAGRPAGCKP